MDKKSDKKLGVLTYPLKNLLSAPNMVVDRHFELKNAEASCQIQMRLALRVRTICNICDSLVKSIDLCLVFCCLSNQIIPIVFFIFLFLYTELPDS